MKRDYAFITKEEVMELQWCSITQSEYETYYKNANLYILQIITPFDKTLEVIS